MKFSVTYFQTTKKENLRATRELSCSITKLIHLVPQTLTAWFYHVLWSVQSQLCLLQSLAFPLPISLFLSESQHKEAPTNNNNNSPYKSVNLSLFRLEKTCAYLSDWFKNQFSKQFAWNIAISQDVGRHRQIRMFLPKPNSVAVLSFNHRIFFLQSNVWKKITAVHFLWNVSLC